MKFSRVAIEAMAYSLPSEIIFSEDIEDSFHHFILV